MAALVAAYFSALGLTPVSSAGAVTPALTLVGGPGRSTGTPAPWTTDRFAAFYTQSITGEVFSSAAVGDVTGDGKQTVVAGFPDGHVYGWRVPDGERVFKLFTGAGAVQASSTLVDLDGNGVLDILSSNTTGTVVGFTAAGKELFRATTDCRKGCGVFGTPTVADIDRDGRREVIASAWDEHIYAWHVDNGSSVTGFPVSVGDSSWSSPSIGDLDGDGFPEIVVGGDCDGVPGQRCTPQRGGYVWVFRHDGAIQPGWPRFVPTQVVWSSPALIDLDGDGHLDVVVGTGTNMAPPAGSTVYAFDRAGHDLPGWPVATGGRVMGSPAVGDIDNDGALDVVVPAEDGRIYAFDRRGHTLPGWPQCNSSDRNACPVVAHGSVVLADILGEGRPQVINGGEQWMRVFGADGQLRVELETKGGTAPLSASPTVAAVDGVAWIFQTAGFSPDPTPTPQLGGVWAWRSSQGLGRAPWPTFKQNMARSGSPIAPPTGVVQRTQVTTRPRATAPRPKTSVTAVPATTTAPTITVVEVTSTTRHGLIAAPHRHDSSSGAGRSGLTVLAVLLLTVPAAMIFRRRARPR